MDNVRIVNDLGQTRLVSIAAFAGGAYCGWTLAEGQHWAVRALAAFVGGAGASVVAEALLG